MSSENPRIGKVLRIPIEIVTGDETKVDETIQKLSKAQGAGLSSGVESMEQQAIIQKTLGKSKIGDIMALSKDQISNVVGMAKSPDGFIMRIFMSKFAKGAGALLLATAIMEAIKFGIEYLTRDGMPLDRRFKRVINAEVAAFLDRMFKAQLRQGFRTLITTSIGGLRGGQGNIGGNIYSIMDRSMSSKIPANFYGREISAYDMSSFNPNGMPSHGSRNF